MTEPTMTNFDGSIDPDMGIRLRAGEHGQHTAWDFWGEVWFSDGMFHERVMQHHAHIGTVTAPSLPELMEAVNSRYGWA